LYIGAYNLCPRARTQVELWFWRRSRCTLRQRSERPWKNADRHADHFKRLP
jgi:hypothetical protein